MKPKPKITSIKIFDELGQEWSLDNQDELWSEVMTLTEDGTKDAILPLSVILNKRGWGWWSCFKSQDDWMRGCGIPIADHSVLAEVNQPGQLGPLLQRFGGYVAFLEAQIGLLAGRRSALKQSYETAMAIHTAEYTSGSQKAKEAEVLSENETLKQAKRLFIETDMLYETAKGMCAAYTVCHQTVSRLVTIQTSEMELLPRRSA